MTDQKFYEIIQQELDVILQENTENENIKKHKKDEHKKGYALLIWFLKFYGLQPIYKSYITDGKDDNSCDVIFFTKNTKNENVYYVVQSKYVASSTAKIQKEEFNATLTDFRGVLEKKAKVGKNENFNKKYTELISHLENNGEAVFIFFTLATYNEEITQAIQNFNDNYNPKISLAIIDLEKIKQDYIAFKFKEILPFNPLEYKEQNPEETPIKLSIERYESKKRDVFEFQGRAKACTILLKPQTIHELFKKYAFKLFFKNVRNPIHRSNYNEKIVDTLLKAPANFWYFNNGITAITPILPDISPTTKNITLESGLQIINGAQTVYSVYSAYENATKSQRKSMDEYARISMRIIASSDEDFNLQITRYTNMQNPLQDRDFWANDDIQLRLQQESFMTNVWYEKRHDEFRLSEEAQEKLGIKIVKNEEFALAYVVFYLQKISYISENERNYIFISYKDHPKGLYEKVFDKNIKFENMFASWIMVEIFKKQIDEIPSSSNEVINIFKNANFFLLAPSLAISKIITEKYFSYKFPNNDEKKMNICVFIIEKYITQNKEYLKIFEAIASYSTASTVNYFELNDFLTISNFLDNLRENPLEYDIFSKKIQEAENKEIFEGVEKIILEKE